MLFRSEGLLGTLSQTIWQTRITTAELKDRPEYAREFGFDSPQFAISIQSGVNQLQLLIGAELMNLFVNYRKVFTYSSKIELTGSQLKVKAGFPDEQTYDLNDIIARYGEDHGCIALAIGDNTGTLIWHETTRMSYVYRDRKSTRLNSSH